MSPRSATENERLREARRRRILDAARGVFARKGLGATRVHDLAQAAGMSLGLLYHYFPDKESVFSELLAEAVAASVEGMRQLLRAEGSGMDVLSQVCAAMLRSVRESPESITLVLQALTLEDAPEPTRALVLAASDELVQAIARLIERARSEGETVSTDALLDARLLVAAIRGLAIVRIEQPQAPLPDVQKLLRLVGS